MTGFELFTTVLGIIGTVCAIVFGYIAFHRNSRSDDEAEGKKDGVLLTEIGYIKSGVDDIKRKQEKEDERHVQVVSRLTIDKRNRSFANSAGLPRVTIHDFRHSHASLLANSGINIQEVARRLGHSNVEMTWNTYSHLYPKEEERALSVLNKIKI